MVIKVYLSRVSGNMEIKKNQEFLVQVLKGRKIDFEEIDISDPTLDEDRQFMRDNSTPKGNNKYGLPPQIFNDTTYCGDYEEFHEANESDNLFNFLKLDPPTKDGNEEEEETNHTED